MAVVGVVAAPATFIFSIQKAPPARRYLRASLDGSTLVVEGQRPAAYKVLANGARVWPCPECAERGRLAAPLGGLLAEVEVSCCGAWRLYVVRLSNGTYAFARDGRASKSACIA